MANYERHRLLFMATDPVHIGTGGYRLGRVDNSIVREPGTRVPKIPGTSLHGAARSYAAQLYESPASAGQDQKDVPNPGADPVCYTFGYLTQDADQPDKARGYSGVVNIFDAHILLFPVYSMAGPVWVSTVERLRDGGLTVSDPPANWDSGSALVVSNRKDDFNLGWLMVKVAGKVTVTAHERWSEDKRWKSISDNIVVVKDSLFSHIVNSNLEVRTSVAIDPERGAAEDKALFTYEALPRTTFLTSDIVLDDYRDGDAGRPFPKQVTAKEKPLPGGGWTGPLDVAKAGLRMIEWLGVGGMGTRGFGRISLVGEPLVQKFGEEGEWQ